jgi:chromosome segregation ATPase
MAAKKPSFLPMLFLIILSVLNVIAAGFLFYFVGKDAVIRAAWVKALDDRMAQRDGLTTDKLISQLTPDEKDRLKAWEADWTKRKTAAALRLDPLKERVDLIGKEDSEKVAKEYGAEDYRRILHEYIKLRTPELRGEEQRLAEEKNTLLQVRDKYDERIARLQEQINRFATDDKKPEELLAKEKLILEKLNAENQERRREIAGLYAEVEEAAAARELADGNLNDYKRRRDDIRQRAAELIKENTALEAELRKLERVSQPTTTDERGTP